jgi:cytochrome P450
MLAYAFHSPSLHSTLSAETAPSLQADGSINITHLMTQSPHLDALWHEILRLTNASSALRTVTQPTRVGTKLLQPGHKVMSPFRQLHFDETVFGANVSECDPDRFFNRRELARHPSFKPFGGGVTKCPGRFVAHQETYIFVVLVLHRLRVELVGGGGGQQQAFPRFELDTPTTGIISPKVGDDVFLSISAKM